MLMLLRAGREVLTIDKIAEEVENELKLSPVGSIVNSFRTHKKMEVLDAVLPLLSTQNQADIRNVLDKKVVGLYY